MDARVVLAAFDEQIRRNPGREGPDGAVERDQWVVRSVSPSGGWTGITWSDLDERNVDAAIAGQISRFASLAQPWEWKHYSYDQPPNLPERLLSAGFAAEPSETVLVAEIADLELDVPPPRGVDLVPVVDKSGVDAMVSVHHEVFGGDHSHLGRTFLAALARPAQLGRGRCRDGRDRCHRRGTHRVP